MCYYNSGEIMKNIKDFNFKNKSVLIRCDLNVTLKDGKILDDTRIISSVKSIKYIIDNGGKAIILSHLGKVKTIEDEAKYSLFVVFERLKELIPNLSFCDSLDFDTVRDFVNNVDYGSAVLLQNTRFYDLDGNLESGNSDKLASFYASLGDIFINDAFGTLHREHASNVGISSHLKSGVGFLVQNELKNLNILFKPKHPFVVIMGGAKISDKVKVIDKLIKKVDILLIGGAMANTFLVAKGFDMGSSLYEANMISYCEKLLEKYESKIILPIDFYCSTTYADGDKVYTSLFNFPKDMMALDIGDKSVSVFKNEIKGCKTLFWNGPIGVSEFSNFSYGTKKVMDYIANNVDVSIFGGGDIVAALSNFGYKDKVYFYSTGGGATLEYISSGKLVGLKNIK